MVLGEMKWGQNKMGRTDGWSEADFWNWLLLWNNSPLSRHHNNKHEQHSKPIGLIEKYFIHFTKSPYYIASLASFFASIQLPRSALSLFTCKRALTNNVIRLAAPTTMTTAKSSAGDGVMPKQKDFLMKLTDGWTG